MRKLLLLLLFPLISFAQNSNIDLGSREMFKVYKKFPVESLEIKGLLKDYLSDISLKTKDTILIKEIELYSKSLDTITLPSYKSIDFETLSDEKLKNFKSNYDKFKKSGFIRHKKYNQDKFEIYLTINKEMSHIRINSTYSGNGWLFVNKLQFIIDGKDYYLEFLNSDREVKTGGLVEESIDIAVNKKAQKLLDALYETESDIDVRFSGDKGKKDFVLTQKQLIPIKETIDLYNSL